MSVLSIRTKLAVLAISTLAACSTDDGVTPPPGPAPVASIVVTPAEIYLPIGVAMDLQVQLKAADGTILQGRTITYTSGSAAVATVSPTGRITGVAEGITTITVRSEGKQTIVPIVVAEVVPAVERIVMSRVEMTLLAGQADVVQATPVDAEGTILADVEITWSSSNPGVATVNTDGLITTHAAGQVQIHAYGGDKRGTVTVNVLPQAVALHTFEYLGIGGDATNRTVKAIQLSKTEFTESWRVWRVVGGETRWNTSTEQWTQSLVLRQELVSSVAGNTMVQVEQETTIVDAGSFTFRWPGDFIDLASTRTSTTLTARMVGPDILRVRLPLDGIGEVELDFVKRN
jgi:hypothetical protein